MNNNETDIQVIASFYANNNSLPVIEANGSVITMTDDVTHFWSNDRIVTMNVWDRAGEALDAAIAAHPPNSDDEYAELRDEHTPMMVLTAPEELNTKLIYAFRRGNRIIPVPKDCELQPVSRAPTELFTREAWERQVHIMASNAAQAARSARGASNAAAAWSLTAVVFNIVAILAVLGVHH